MEITSSYFNDKANYKSFRFYFMMFCDVLFFTARSSNNQVTE
ncbi:unnamed protein product [Brugia pahangi]|uniref:DUF805 domain-containing protein n=1 Tax=Brugia pahangi TaxID=6280 RepID=A0A0N4TR39_BRUPA|nr:unnamed protein product [Brugia pahangi]